MLADDAAAILVAEGLGELGTTLVIGAMPPSPDVVTVIAETGGRSPSFAFAQALPVIDYPRLQFRTRGEPDDYEAPRLAIERIYQMFMARRAETISGGARYMSWDPIQTPFELAQDDNRRWVFAVNFEVWKELSAL